MSAGANAGATERPGLTTEELRALACEAAIYGTPMVEMYRTLHAQSVDLDGPNFRAHINQFGHTAQVFTPRDTAFVTPNADTPYSFLWMDLRAEPLVLTLPVVQSDRYVSVQLIDLFTHNVDYLGTRTSGNGGGRYLITGPGWTGGRPPGVDRIVRFETQLGYAIVRTQLLDADDLARVRAVQAGFGVEPLSSFLGLEAPQPCSAIDWPPPPGASDALEFFRILDFLLQFAPTHPSETECRRRFAELGLGTGQWPDLNLMPEHEVSALQQGIADAGQAYKRFARLELARSLVPSARVFGNRESLGNNYVARYAGAMLGIFGNSAEEAIYLGYYADADGQELDAAAHDYSLRFAPDQFPPAGAFWSLTLYDGQTKLLVANPLDRYLVNSRMLNELARDEDGGITLLIGQSRPEGTSSANWLPAPAGPFNCVLRLYLPGQAALSGQWRRPEMTRRDL